MNTKPRDVTRQCQYLKTQGDEIAKVSSFVLWSWDKSEYFMKLRDYCKFHKEINIFLNAHYKDNELIMERVKQLPDIDFKDYSGEQMGWRSFVTGVLLYVFFFVSFHLDARWNSIHQRHETKNISSWWTMLIHCIFA